jgi:hypothetical protein
MRYSHTTGIVLAMLGLALAACNEDATTQPSTTEVSDQSALAVTAAAGQWVTPGRYAQHHKDRPRHGNGPQFIRSVDSVCHRWADPDRGESEPTAGLQRGHQHLVVEGLHAGSTIRVERDWGYWR